MVRITIKLKFLSMHNRDSNTRDGHTYNMESNYRNQAQ